VESVRLTPIAKVQGCLAAAGKQAFVELRGDRLLTILCEPNH
jgi:hypothetical protein